MSRGWGSGEGEHKGDIDRGEVWGNNLGQESVNLIKT